MRVFRNVPTPEVGRIRKTNERQFVWEQSVISTTLLACTLLKESYQTQEAKKGVFRIL